MKLQYTIRKYDEQSDSFAEKEGPFESDLAKLLFVEMISGRKTNNWFGVVPPYKILKEILKDGAHVNTDNILFEWAPFELKEKDFEKILVDVKANPEWEIEIEFPPDNEEDWSHWALVRALGKDKQNDGT